MTFEDILTQAQEKLDEYQAEHEEENRDEYPESLYRDIIAELLPDNSDDEAFAEIVYSTPGILNCNLTERFKDGFFYDTSNPPSVVTPLGVIREAVIVRLCDELGA